METTTTETQPTTVKLRAVCETAVLDLKTGTVELTKVDPTVCLIQDLVREIQALQTQLNELKAKAQTETKAEEVVKEPTEQL